MTIHSKRKYIIYLMGIIIMIAIAVTATSDGMKDGEIIFLSEREDENNIMNEEIISSENGIDVVVEGEKLIKYKDRTELIVNINTASEEDMIRLLPGIGSKRAAAIVEYRELSGGFNSVEELCEVDGIGDKIAEKLRPYCTIEGPSVQYSDKHENESEEQH